MVATHQRRARQSDKPPTLHDGDRLDQETFHARYEAMPSVRAQLIGGIVFMSSPMKKPHGKFIILLSRWLGEYEEATPGTEALAGATEILGSDSEPESDACLLILPEYGGQTTQNDKGYIDGAPEWVAEIADTTESLDLHAKKRDYEKAGVREYLVVALRSKKVHLFARKRGKLKDVAAASDGINRSEAFPGLWLDPAALLRRDSKRLMAVLRLGLASPEHAAFVAVLAEKKSAAEMMDKGSLRREILLLQFLDRIVVVFDVEVEPVAGHARFADADAGGESAAVVAAGGVPRHQRRHQAVGEAPFGLLVGSGHRHDHIAAHERVPLTDVEAATHAAPIVAVRRCRDRMALGTAALHVDDRQLPAARVVIVAQQVNQHLLRHLLVGEQIEGAAAPFFHRIMLRAKHPDAGPGMRHILARGPRLARHGSPALPRVRVDRRDGKGRGFRLFRPVIVRTGNEG